MLVLGVFTIVGVVALGACGDDDSSSGATETTVKETTTTGDGGEGVATEFVGLSTVDATAKAEKDGNPWRIAEEDGEVFALTMDYNPERVNFVITEGKVTQATWG